MNFSQLDRMLTGRNQASRKIGNNTYAERRGECIAVRLHATDILTFSPDGSVRYDSGGWQTVTTKARMNEFGPAGVSISQHQGLWTVHSDRGTSVPYADGLIYRPNGVFENFGSVDESLALKKSIAKFAKTFVTKLFAGELKPTGGECLYCQGIVKNFDGSPSKDTTHIRSHVDEGYYVPHLVVAAATRFGASQYEKHVIAACLNGQNVGADKLGFGGKQIEKHLRRYLQLQLGLAA